MTDQSRRRDAGPVIARARGWHRQILVGLGLFLVVAGVFLPTVRNDFITYDDPAYVTQNPHVTGGLTLENVRWAFTSTQASNWHPLTWLSHMADCQVYGLAPWGHHLTSVLLHALNALLLFVGPAGADRGDVAELSGGGPVRAASAPRRIRRLDRGTEGCPQRDILDAGALGLRAVRGRGRAAAVRGPPMAWRS